MKMSSNNAVQTCVLPKWEDRRLGDIGEPLMCKRVLKDETAASGEIPFYKIGTFGGEPDAYISRSLYERLREKYPYPKKGDVLISAAGTVGRTVVFDGREAYFQDSNIVWIDNDESVVTNEYLSCLYSVLKWQTEDGGVVSRLYNENLRNQIISVPPLAEQRRIAEVLADADALIGNMEKRIAKRKLIKQGMMQQLLTGAVRLPGFTGEWVERRLFDIGDFIKGAGISRAESQTGDIPAIRYGELYTHHDNYVKKYVSRISEEVSKQSRQTKRGDILFTCSGETAEDIGKAVAVLDDGVYAGGDLLILTLHEEGDPVFWGTLMNMPYVQIQKSNVSHGATVIHITEADLREVIVRYPPTLAEQRAIAAVLTDMDSEIAVLEKKVEKYRRLKSGMMSELLTGKVRLTEGK